MWKACNPKCFLGAGFAVIIPPLVCVDAVRRSGRIVNGSNPRLEESRTLDVSRKSSKPSRHVLNHIRKNKSPVTVFLVNGVKLQGIVTWFDNFCILLRRDGHSQLVYKHAVSTVMPVAPVQLYDEKREVEHADD